MTYVSHAESRRRRLFLQDKLSLLMVRDAVPRTVLEWRTRVIEQGDLGEPSRWKIDQALRSLIARGLVDVERRSGGWLYRARHARSRPF